MATKKEKIEERRSPDSATDEQIVLPRNIPVVQLKGSGRYVVVPGHGKQLGKFEKFAISPKSGREIRSESLDFSQSVLPTDIEEIKNSLARITSQLSSLTKETFKESALPTPLKHLAIEALGSKSAASAFWKEQHPMLLNLTPLEAVERGKGDEVALLLNRIQHSIYY